MTKQNPGVYAGSIKRVRRILIVAAAALVVELLVLRLTGIRINASVSAPIGFYIPNPDGSYIGFCPADHRLSAVRHYRGAAIPGWPNSCPDGAEQLLKPVVAKAGDTVVLDSVGFIVNGKRLPHSAALDHDSEGRPMTRWPFGTYAVSVDQLWVISSYSARSYDSRYFGPVDAALIRARYRPLLVAE